ncbi:MAG: hypothetical protein ACSHXI_19665 [Hoeflea sp.]|uniref:hypothetical protein n=1 Tax=Hoeflea sp. TaxID=1940281 RepID=UPI003EF3FDE9
MSYYDHATMMAHKLGPWADNHSIEEAEMRTRLNRIEGSGLWPSIKTMLRRFRIHPAALTPGAQHPDQESVLCPDGDAPRKT